jgi:hypothetical protein
VGGVSACAWSYWSVILCIPKSLSVVQDRGGGLKAFGEVFGRKKKLKNWITLYYSSCWGCENCGKLSLSDRNYVQLGHVLTIPEDVDATRENTHEPNSTFRRQTTAQATRHARAGVC